MKSVRNLIEEYVPYNMQEEKDKAVMLGMIDEGTPLFTRDNQTAHWTASSWIVNPAMDRVLMVYHNIYNSWSWTGGHADGDEDLLAVAIREAKEETGLTEVKPVSEDLLSLEILTVDGHVKREEYVSSHLHLNLTFLLMADDTKTLRVKEDENSGVRWFTMEEALQASSEPWFVTNIYSKLNEKVKMIRRK